MVQLSCTLPSVGAIQLCNSPRWNTSHYTCFGADYTLLDAPSLTGLLGVVQIGRYRMFVFTLILLLVTVVGCLCWLVFCLHGLRRSWSREDCCPKKSLREIWGSIRRGKWLLTPESHYSDVEETLRTQMLLMAQHQRILYFLRGAKGVAYLLPPIVLWSFVQMTHWRYFMPGGVECFGPVAVDCDLDTLWKQQMLTAKLFGTALITGLCLFAAICSDAVGPRFICATHSAVHLGLAYHLWDMVSLHEFQQLHNGFLVQVRLAAALFCGKFATTLALNVAMFSLQVFWLAFRVESDGFNNQGVTTRESCVLLLVVLAVAYAFEHSLLSQVRQMAMTQASSREAQTAKNILNQLCDAVVELYGAQLRLKTPCPKLATLTFREHVAGYLQGTSFVDLICEPDRPRFLAELHKSIENTFSMHLHLLDCRGARVAVQIFVACLPAWNGLLEYVVGIREDGDNEQCGEPACLPHFVPGHSRGVRVSRQQSLGRAVEGEQTSESGESVMSSSDAMTESASDSGTDISLSLLRPTVEGHRRDLLVWVEKTSMLTMVVCSRSFLNAFGPSFGSVGIDFAAWVREPQGFTFRAWVRSLDDDKQEMFQKLKLYPPHLAQSLQVTCTVTFIKLDSPFVAPISDLPFQPAVVLKLSKLQYCSLPTSRACCFKPSCVHYCNATLDKQSGCPLV
eukprot:TRINITY_DN25796_c0_g1_i6.p1 TRINITY_DN25796_c0_g1~~TRINITY_DN25796_c0_g1_i6.p1  ORF type:complete len:679 (-),score=42.20 TRINITY_DN25796_c0_g1_i6:84-2120(-)